MKPPGPHQRGLPAANLLHGPRRSAAGLRSALDEAQRRSLQNQRVLREAGEQGQRLIAEELTLQRRLEECRSELRAGHRHAPVDGEDLERRGSERTARASTASTSTTSSPQSLAPSDAEPQPGKAADSGRRELQAEKGRLLQLNLMLAEELEEQERELFSKTPGCSEPSLNEDRPLIDAHLSEITDAVAHAASAERKRVQEHQATTEELHEARLQADGMFSALEQQLEAAHARRGLLHSELHHERALRARRTACCQEAIEHLHMELAELQRSSETAKDELLELQRRLAAQEEARAEECQVGSAPQSPTAPAAPEEAEMLGSEWRSAADALCRSPDVQCPRRGSTSSNASESWDDRVSETDTASLSGAARAHRATLHAAQRRRRAQGGHAYRPSEAVLMVKVSGPNPSPQSSWRDTLVGLLSGS